MIGSVPNLILRSSYRIGTYLAKRGSCGLARRALRVDFTWQLSHFSPLPLYSGGEGQRLTGGEHPLQMMEFSAWDTAPPHPRPSPPEYRGRGTNSHRGRKLPTSNGTSSPES